jgi:putative membrane protein
MNDVVSAHARRSSPMARWGRVALAAAAIGLIASLQAPVASAQAVVPGASSAPAGKLSHKDSAFLKQAAENGHAEVENSKLALQKSGNAEVKSFAQQMVDDHTKAGQELAALAAAKGVDLPKDPSVMQKGKMKMLSARDGTSFDRHYAESVGVEAHRDTVKLFEKASREADNADIKAFATKTLPTLQHHLQAAEALQMATRAADGKKAKQ